MNHTEFVAKYEELIGENPTLEQQLLLKYFKQAKDDLPVEWGRQGFHTAWRKVDIIYNRGMASKDMIVYNLMHEDDKVWEVVDLLSETGV